MLSLEYVAGFVDGEGSIGFGRTRTSIFPRVFVTNTNLSILEQFKEQFGGDIKPLSERRVGWKQGYAWRISWSRAVDFLDSIIPYLTIKSQQAHTVFAWDAIRPGMGGRQDAEACELLLRRIHWLNAKGPVVGSDPIDEIIALDVARRARAKVHKKV